MGYLVILRCFSFASAGSCVVGRVQGWVLLSGVFWCGVFCLLLVVVSGVWLFVVGAYPSCLGSGSWCPFEVAVGSLWGRGGAYCVVWPLFPLLGCVAVPVLGSVRMGGWGLGC